MKALGMETRTNLTVDEAREVLRHKRFRWRQSKIPELNHHRPFEFYERVYGGRVQKARIVVTDDQADRPTSVRMCRLEIII